MTYLQLINAVLVRLREDTIDETQVDSDPYWRSIGAHVNDAKDRVEDAWQWSALRGTDVIDVTAQSDFELQNSADNHYIIKRVYSSEQYDPLLTLPALREMRQLTVDGIRQRYKGGVATLPQGQPYEFAVTGRASSGNIKCTMYPPPGPDTYSITVDRVNHQPALDGTTNNPDGQDRNNLLVPSLPVYTLATALASRERGEVGGTPTSELFAIADRHLSDTIAQDSTLYANELDWFSAGDSWVNTNVRAR